MTPTTVTVHPGADATAPAPPALRAHRATLQRRERLQADTALLLVERARAAWGLVPGVPAQPWPATPEAAPWAAVHLPQAHALICRTGCALDRDHWRAGEQCRRTGQPCDEPQGGTA